MVCKVSGAERTIFLDDLQGTTAEFANTNTNTNTDTNTNTRPFIAVLPNPNPLPVTLPPPFVSVRAQITRRRCVSASTARRRLDDVRRCSLVILFMGLPAACVIPSNDQWVVAFST